MKTIRCPQCNLADWENVAVCKRCKYEFQTVEQNEVPAEESLESPYQREGSELQQQQIIQEPAPEIEPEQFEQPEVQTDAPPLPEERFEQNYQTNQQAPPQQTYQPRYAYSNTATKPKIKLAVMSMIFGILGMPFVSMFWGFLLVIILGIIFGSGGAIFGGIVVLLMLPAGLILGIASLLKSNRKPAEYGGKGFAIAGIVCSSMGLLILPVIAAVAVPNILAARRAANESSAILAVRTMSKGQQTLRDQRGGHCGDLNELRSIGIIDDELAIGQKNGYQFVISKFPVGGCEITATPLSNFEGDRSFFYSTQDHVIRAAIKDGKVADVNDPPIDSDTEFLSPKIASSEDF